MLRGRTLDLCSKLPPRLLAVASQRRRCRRHCAYHRIGRVTLPPAMRPRLRDAPPYKGQQDKPSACFFLILTSRRGGFAFTDKRSDRPGGASKNLAPTLTFVFPRLLQWKWVSADQSLNDLRRKTVLDGATRLG